MLVDGIPRRALEAAPDGRGVVVLDQTRLPHRVLWREVRDLEAAARVIATMQVRGAPLIGVTAAYGLALALRTDAGDAALEAARARLLATRPTAVNLRWALDRVTAVAAPRPPASRAEAAWAEAGRLADEDVATNRRIGEHGVALLRDAARRRGGAPVRILTHCNAGWLAAVDRGTATAPIYRAQEEGIPLHVWVDETRPRGQGAALTAWELGQQGVPHTVVVDNAGGHLLQRGEVDLCLVGTDRTTRRGDVANKIGTYLKALAAREHGVPFYVALPRSSWDGSIRDGVADVPIEERDGAEVAWVTGRTADGSIESVRVVPEGSPVANPAFDVTPAALVTAFVTDHGVLAPTEAALAVLGRETEVA